MPRKRPSRVQQQRDEAFRDWLRRQENSTASQADAKQELARKDV